MIALNIRVRLLVGGDVVKTDVLEIAEHKLEPLDDDEIEQSIEVLVRNWADKHIAIDWETE